MGKREKEKGGSRRRGVGEEPGDLALDNSLHMKMSGHTFLAAQCLLIYKCLD